MMIGAKYEKGNEEGRVSPAELRRVVSGHMPALDGLRGIAILLVLVIHFTWSAVFLAGPSGIILLSITDSGWTGVELFFVLSGFLITGILLDSKGAENYLSSFYIRRALRILPLSYAALFFWFILCPYSGKWACRSSPRHFPRFNSGIGFMSEIGHPIGEREMHTSCTS